MYGSFLMATLVQSLHHHVLDVAIVMVFSLNVTVCFKFKDREPSNRQGRKISLNTKTSDAV